MSSSRKKPKLCRYLKKPCIEDECIHWVGYPTEKLNAMTGTKVVETAYMCNDLWQAKIAFDAAGFADHFGKAIEELRNHVAEGNANMGAMIFEERRRLAGDNQSRNNRQIGQAKTAKALPAEPLPSPDQDSGTEPH